VAPAQHVAAMWHGLSKINENGEYVEQNNIVNIASNVCLSFKITTCDLKGIV
jgi:hypothetical protein